MKIFKFRLKTSGGNQNTQIKANSPEEAEKKLREKYKGAYEFIK